MTALDEAIRIGEDAVARSLAMANRERRLRWWLLRTKLFIASGRPAKAMEVLDKALAIINEGAEEMAVGPPLSWVHQLHRVTGLFALRGDGMNEHERAEVIAILERVVTEMRDEQNWRRR